MFDNVFNGMFRTVKQGWCRLTLNGDIAVKCDNKYKTYNVKKGTLTNVSNFCFDVGEDMFFVLPTNKVKVGDIIIVNDEPKCVINADKNDITVIDYKSSEIKHIVPERHIFMGKTYFYGKIVSMFGDLKSGKGVGNIMKMMLMSKMMGGSNANPLTGGGNGLGQMMAMSMMMGGGNANPFEGMFDFDLDTDICDCEDEDEDEVETKPVKKSKKTVKVEED